MAITLTDVQTDLAYLLGEQAPPASTNSDYEVRRVFIQRALERAYRAYNFPYNKLTATIALVSGVATLPSAVMQDSILDLREAVLGAQNDNIYTNVGYEGSDSYTASSYPYWLTGYQGQYYINTNDTSDKTLTLRYQSGAPIINASVSSPFPSSMAIARGALIYYRQAEDPQADIGQEEALFAGELSEIIAQYNRSRPRRVMVAKNTASNTYIGDIGYLE